MSVTIKTQAICLFLNPNQVKHASAVHQSLEEGRNNPNRAVVSNMRPKWGYIRPADDFAEYKHHARG